MNAPSDALRPGDLILNRYMLNATEEEHEDARENLRRLARVLMRIEARLAREWHKKRIRESGEYAVNLKGDISLHL